jgi:hypothetical protein
MAFTGYGAKYTLTFSDVYQNTTGQYIATIYKKGYSGFVNEVSGTGTPLVIETDRDGGNGGYRPVIATKATLNLLFNYVGVGLGTDEWTPNTNIWETYERIFSESGFDIREFITADADTFLLEVKKNNGASYDIIWQGYYIYNTDVSLNEIAPITFSLQFSDFGLMKINRFYNFTTGDTNLIKYYPSDKISLLDIIMRCCYFSYITTRASIEITSFTYNQSYLDGNGGTQTESLGIDNIFIQKNAFIEALGKYQNLFDVLSGICSQYGLIAFFKNNKFCVRSYEKLVNNTTGTISTKEYLVYYYNDVTDKVEYTFDANVTETDSIVALNSSTFKNIGRDQNIRFNYPIESITISNSDSLNNNTPNYNMSSLSQVNSPGGSVYYAINSWYLPSGVECDFDFYDQVSVTAPNCVALPFYPYVRLKTDTYGTNFSTQFKTKYVGGFDSSRFIDSEPFTVTTGDVFSLSYSAYTDGRLKNLPPTGGMMNQANMRPNPVLALILIADDSSGAETTYFYNYSTNKFITTNTYLPLVTTTNAIADSDWIHYDLKGTLDIPQSGKLKIRQYQPWRGLTSSLNDDRYELYVEYCNLQLFKGTPISNLPKSQRFLSKVTNLRNSDGDFELKSNIFIQNAQTYVPSGVLSATDVKQKNPMFVASCYGNHVFDRYNYPASGISLSYANPACINISYGQLYNNLQYLTLELLDNICVTNVTVEGTYKSTGNYYIGNKFSYQITGYDSKNFALLDYSIDFKNATYNSLLYSSNFSDGVGITTTTQTIIS